MIQFSCTQQQTCSSCCFSACASRTDLHTSLVLRNISCASCALYTLRSADIFWSTLYNNSKIQSLTRSNIQCWQDLNEINNYTWKTRKNFNQFISKTTDPNKVDYERQCEHRGLLDPNDCWHQEVYHNNPREVLHRSMLIDQSRITGEWVNVHKGQSVLCWSCVSVWLHRCTSDGSAINLKLKVFGKPHVKNETTVFRWFLQ